MVKNQTIATLEELLKNATPKVRMEILMQIQIAEGQSNAPLKLSKEIQKMIKKKDEL